MTDPQGKVTLGFIECEPVWHGHGGPLALDREVFRTCGQSARMERPGGSDLLRQFFWGLEGGKKYSLSFFTKLEGVKGDDKHPGAGLFVQIRFGTKRADTVYRPMPQKFRGDIPWTRLEYTFTAPEGTGELATPYLEFIMTAGATGKVWIDHVEIKEVKETAAPAKK